MIYLTLGLFYILTKIKFQCGNSLKTNCKLSMNEKLQCWTCCIRVYGNNIISRNIVLEKTKPITWFCSPEGWEVASVCVCVGDKREDEDWCWRVIAALTQSPSNRKHQPPWGPMRARGEQCVLSLVAVNGIFQEAGEQWASHPGGAGAVCLSVCLSVCLHAPGEAATSGWAGASLSRCEDGRCRAKEPRRTERGAFTGIYWTAAGRNYLKVRGFYFQQICWRLVLHLKQQLSRRN